MVFNSDSWVEPWETGYVGIDPTKIIGIAWNTGSTSPTLSRIDVDGNTVTKADEAAWTVWFNSHPIFGQIWRCTLSYDGIATYGTNAKGAGLTLTNDYVMSRIPLHYIKCDLSGSIKKWWISPFPWAGFVPAYGFNQRSHNLSPAKQIYVGSYMAGANGGTTTANGVSNTVNATSWSGLKLTSKSGSTALTGDSGGTTGTMAQFEAAANLIGTGWGITNIHTWSMLRLLAYIRMGTLNCQSAVGAGRTNASNTAALTNGSVSAKEDSMGMSSGTSDTEGVTLFGIENLWGNISHLVIGYNTVDAEHRIVKRDGTGTLAATLTSGNYDSVTSPLPLNGTTNISGTDGGSYCHGYISALGHDFSGYLDHLMIPSALVGSDTTYLTDYYYSHQSGLSQTGVVRAGGDWSTAGNSGVGYMSSLNILSYARPSIGARLEFIG